MRKMLALMLAITLLMVWVPAMADGYSDMLAKAETYYASEDYAKAIASYQLAQKLQPDHAEAFLGEASVHMTLEDYSSAASLIQAAMEIDPVSSDVWYLKCKLDVLLNDISAFEQDAVFAEVCDADLSDMNAMIASMYDSAGLSEKADSYPAMSFTGEAQQGQFRKVPGNRGNREIAEQPGLSSLSKRNTALDDAFDNDNLTLMKTEFPAITAEDFEFPDEIWKIAGVEKPADPIAEMAAVLPYVDFTWISLSPAGNSGLLVDEGSTGVCYYEGKYRVLYPSSTRGVEDTNGNLSRIFSTGLRKLLGKEGVVYSPDGRYAAVFNYEYTLVQMKFILDPIVIDLSTGEMFLTATYQNNYMKAEGAGAVTTAAFSSDGRYLYYMLYGNTAEYHTALYRYDLQEDTTERCYSGSDMTYYPYLSETDSGALIILRDVYKYDEMQGMMRMADEDGTWKGTEFAFDLPLQYWYSRSLMYSANSGYAFVPGKPRSTDFGYAFQCIRPDDDFAGLNQYCAVSKESNQIQVCSADEIKALFGNRTDAATDAYLDMPFQRILTSVLSPDGHYVLLITENSGSRDNPEKSRHLYLVRLADLAIREIEGMEPYAIQVDISKNYPPVIEWNTDTLIIGTDDGIQAYEFKLQ